MALRFLFDENLRGPLWNAVRRRADNPIYPLDVERVGDSDGLPLGSLDPELLAQCEFSGRILVALDSESMPDHVRVFIDSGRHVPGVLIVRRGHSFRDVLDALVLIAHAGMNEDYRDRIEYIP